VKKIPTIYRRDPDNPRYVLPELVPGCEWVFEPDAVPTRKYDGTCVMFDGTDWYARREVKAGKLAPPKFHCVELDENTLNMVGWEPIEQSPFYKFHDEALTLFHLAWGTSGLPWPTGTYELCGPKINGNPEGYATHALLRHADAEQLVGVIGDFTYLANWLGNHTYEGIVWHHPDGRMAKVKRRDFPK
jgi:hypothetical protein